MCDICSLSYEDLTQALVDFPEEQRILGQRAEKRIVELTQLIAAAAAAQEAEMEDPLLGASGGATTAAFDAMLPREHLPTQTEGAEEGGEDEQGTAAAASNKHKQQQKEPGGAVLPRGAGQEDDDWVTMHVVTPLDPTALRNPPGGAAGGVPPGDAARDFEALAQRQGFAPVAASGASSSAAAEQLTSWMVGL